MQLAAEAKAELNCRDQQLRKLWRGFTVNWKETQLEFREERAHMYVYVCNVM